MSKLNKTKSGDKQGKAILRRDSRIQRFERGQKDLETRHQHHKPGSMNMKKSGR